MDSNKLLDIGQANFTQDSTQLYGFDRVELDDIAQSLMAGYEQKICVGDITGEGMEYLESTTCIASKFIKAALTSETKSKEDVISDMYLLKRQIHNLKRHIEDYCQPDVRNPSLVSEIINMAEHQERIHDLEILLVLQDTQGVRNRAIKEAIDIVNGGSHLHKQAPSAIWARQLTKMLDELLNVPDKQYLTNQQSINKLFTTSKQAGVLLHHKLVQDLKNLQRYDSDVSFGGDGDACAPCMSQDTKGEYVKVADIEALIKLD